MNERYGGGERYIAVDLDGTLAAHYWPQEPYHPYRIGTPIVPMVARVRAWLAAGEKVVIFTARVAPGGSAPGFEDDEYLVETIKQHIGDWTLEHIGVRLESTAIKSYHMKEWWDDRSIRVIADIGQPCCDQWEPLCESTITHGDTTFRCARKVHGPNEPPLAKMYVHWDALETTRWSTYSE